MLVLSRKVGEKIVISDEIVVTVVKIDRNQIRLGIQAPNHIPVMRAEIVPGQEAPAPEPPPSNQPQRSPAPIRRPRPQP